MWRGQEGSCQGWRNEGAPWATYPQPTHTVQQHPLWESSQHAHAEGTNNFRASAAAMQSRLLTSYLMGLMVWSDDRWLCRSGRASVLPSSVASARVSLMELIWLFCNRKGKIDPVGHSAMR